MIRWLVQSVHDHPDLARGEAPPGLLSAAESAHLVSLSVPKRRRDWLLGRWTAKHLLAAYLDEEGSAPLLAEITIANDPTGAPYACFDLPEPDCRIPISLTISHSDGISFCALVPQDDAQPGSARLPFVGADVEQIEPRAASFVRDFFTGQEQATLAAVPPQSHDRMATAIWSAKEAALKALHLGLSVDTRRVSVRYEEDAFLRHEPLSGSDPAAVAEASWPPRDLPVRHPHPTCLSTFRVPDAESGTLWALPRQPYDSSEPNRAPASHWTPISISLSGEAAQAATELATSDYHLAAWQQVLTTHTDHTQYVLTLCVLAHVQLSEMAAALHDSATA